ncbi:MAG TPA: dihydroorotase [Candidatus Choladousia intestinavium]|uniref:Dihydroorotase n=1 Tax=Candidatus Choladousia intestinavium TaxID=2840727 RepID=A0A9D1ACX2_9FIRM|nr:dihydroorotase [Candidatus Choladousia intestinavium]
MLIKNGRILSPGTLQEWIGDIRIRNEQIAESGQLSPEPGETVIDASGLCAAPGFVDVHVHFRDPGLTYKEDLHTGSLSAAAGGFTAVVCMANTKPVMDTPGLLKDFYKRASREKIRIYSVAAVTKGLLGKELTDFLALGTAGACGFSDDGIPLMDEKLAVQAMLRAKKLDLPLSFHEEDPNFIEKSGTNQTAPAIAEDLLVARDCMLALHTGARISIQHISSRTSVALVRTAKALGAKVFAEATPHHFSLTEDALKEHGTLAKMNPPLRTEKDRLAIIEGLKDGTIDAIATDHAPHSSEEKARPFFEAPSGIIGLETSLALGITNLVRPGHLTLLSLMEKMSANPARLYKMPFGTIAPGAPADVVLFDPDELWVPEGYSSKSSNSPFTGCPLYGKVHATICRGEVIYSRGR